MQKLVHGILHADEFVMQGARVSNAADTTAEGTQVGIVFPFEQVVDVNQPDLFRRFGERVAAAGAG